MSDLLNDPTRPACGCDHCTKHPSAWVEGSILQPALEQVGLTTAGPPPGASIPEVVDHQRAVAQAWWARCRQDAWARLGLKRPVIVLISADVTAALASFRAAAAVLPPQALASIDGTAS